MSPNREITIVGAGQSGLQLAIGLLAAGFQVRLVSDRTGAEIAAGRVTSSQCMFDTALGHERALGLDFWADAVPPIDGIAMTILNPPGTPLAGSKAIEWAARLDAPAQSVDQRVKMSAFMAEFVRRGGELVIHEASVEDLEIYTQQSDMVIVAAGKGAIAKLFARDAQRSYFDSPQRALALTYVNGMAPRPDHSAVGYNIIPGVGEYFTFPALTLTGPCDIMVFEGIPGGPWDCWADARTPEQHFETSQRLVSEFLPWEAERCRNVSLTDELGTLAGRFPPTVRHPVATLDSGRKVLGMADVVVLNDPLTGQGSNNASKCAAMYLGSIVKHGDRPFDQEFMQSTFENYWEYAQFVTAFTNSMLLPPPPHVLELFKAAETYSEIGHRFAAAAADDARDLFTWFTDPELAQGYLSGLVAMR
ncbi:styrene monooxygenase/indole monooxygenase family protein [Nocardia amamiensis]|uniref:styrene monooxygenase/indole monooxygenase family protein n=1 Tax=Nocardia amamiensis TaxID=404578 RepID=UPI0008355FDB|nr:styrene monooxygenase/indole monooxygenase family protein [Nocardia amamiensis]